MPIHASKMRGLGVNMGETETFYSFMPLGMQYPGRELSGENLVKRENCLLLTLFFTLHQCFYRLSLVLNSPFKGSFCLLCYF